MQYLKILRCNLNTLVKIILGDFNAKIGVKAPKEPSFIGNFGFGMRHHREDMMLNFLNKEHLYRVNTFYKKNPGRKWTWKSPDGRVKNEIDYILVLKNRMCSDVSVINSIRTAIKKVSTIYKTEKFEIQHRSNLCKRWNQQRLTKLQRNRQKSKEGMEGRKND